MVLALRTISSSAASCVRHCLSDGDDGLNTGFRPSSIASGRPQVRDGRLDYAGHATDAPTIVDLQPLAVSSDCEDVTFGIEGMDGSSFKVLMRTAHDYLDLDVFYEERKCPGAPTIVAAR